MSVPSNIGKVTFNGDTLIDLTSDTVETSKLMSGYTAHGADGLLMTGSYVPPTVSDLTSGTRY